MCISNNHIDDRKFMRLPCKTNSSFDGDGIRNTDFSISSLVIDSNGKIVVGGSSIGRFNIDGILDKTFSEDGIQMTDFAIASVVLQNRK
jgi:hypothetical protein